MKNNYWISTDLDGTLLDHKSYSFKGALDGLELCEKLSVPIILNTSKTYDETLHIQQQIGIQGPLIVENGSALILSSKIENTIDGAVVKTLINGATQITFGSDRSKILAFIAHVRAQQEWRFQGFNDWNVSQISEHTGLSEDEAMRAANKYFSEPLQWHDSDENLQIFEAMATEHGFKLVKGGRFYHLQGQCTKATPLHWLKENLSLLPNFTTKEVNSDILVGLGDNNNDIDMLNISDIPVCIKTYQDTYPSIQSTDNAIYTTHIGPYGWSEAITKILNEIE